MQPHRFARFELRPAERQLLIEGQVAAVGARAFDVLLALVERRERVVSKSELFDLVWPDTVVEENNLAVHVRALRRLLGPTAITTIPGRGYRCTAPSLEGAAAEDSTRSDARAADSPGVGAQPAPDATSNLKTNLPEALPPLIGRDADLDALGALLARHRLVTIVGAGGIGKTLLAQHALSLRREGYAHGVGWVELVAVTDSAQVVGAIAGALHVRPGSGDLRGLAAALAPLELMLALDNAEHLVHEIAQVARMLLDHAPGVRLLVTSQAPLRLAQEHVHRLGALAAPASDTLPPADALGYGAVGLFVERARAAGGVFALAADNCADVIDIVRRLDGLPLAIELAAARVPLLGLRGLRATLDERLRVLTAGARDAPARQRTLRAALEWTHALLHDNEQVVFRRLAPICSSASLELVRQLVTDAHIDEWAAVDALGGLVDRTLVAVSGTEPVRYHLLESPRALALERLRAAGEEVTLKARHARSVAAAFECTYDDYFSGRFRVDVWRRAIEPDLDNGRSAFAWALKNDRRAAVAMMPGLLLALLRALVPERQALCDAIDPLLDEPELPLLLRARAAVEAALVVASNRIPLGITLCQRALALARHAGDRRLLCMAWAVMAFGFAQSRDQSSAASEALRQLRDLCDPSWSPQVMRRIHNCRGLLLAAHGRFDDAFADLQLAVRLDEQIDVEEPVALNNLAFVELLAGRHDDALRHSAEVVARLRGTRYADALSLALTHVTQASLEKGDTAQARAAAREGWPQAPHLMHQALWADHLAWLAAAEARPRTAARIVGYADAAYVGLQDARFDSQRAYDEALRIARAALGEGEVQRLIAEGTTLRDEQIEPLAFGVHNDA